MPCSGAACLWHTHGLSSSRTCRIPTASITCPAIGTKIAYKANREGVAERFADPAVHKSIAVDLALITSYDELAARCRTHPRHNRQAP